MPVPYSPLSVANEFVSQFGSQAGIEHMKLQKLVYCSYGWWLSVQGLDGTRLTNEGPEIWKHGPVFASLYDVLKIFGRKPITAAQSSGPFSAPDAIDADDAQIKAMIQWIWNRYGHLAGFALSDLTHKPGTPWHRVATENDFTISYHTKIPDEYIFEEFSSLLSSIKDSNPAANEPQNGGRQPAA